VKTKIITNFSADVQSANEISAMGYFERKQQGSAQKCLSGGLNCCGYKYMKKAGRKHPDRLADS